MKISSFISPIYGEISIATSFRYLCCVEFGPASLITSRFSFLVQEQEPVSAHIIEKVRLALEEGKEYDEPLTIFGTDFQKEVWKAVKNIPYGQIVSYKAVAEEMGRPSATRAVARAVGANPIAVIIPCHRVVGQNNPDAYHWGSAIKRKLLDKEYLATHPTEIVLS